MEVDQRRIRMRIVRYCEVDDSVGKPVTTTIEDGLVVTKVKMELYIEYKFDGSITSETIDRIKEDAVDIVGSAFTTHEEYAMCQRAGRI
jgi:pentose-5-phosphate-3-epimerase